MGDSWLGNDPSTTLEDWDFAIAAKIMKYVRVYVCIMFLLQHKEARGQVKGTCLGEIKAARSYQKHKCWPPQSYSVLHQSSCRLHHFTTICYWVMTTEGSVVSPASCKTWYFTDDTWWHYHFITVKIDFSLKHLYVLLFVSVTNLLDKFACMFLKMLPKPNVANILQGFTASAMFF